MLHLVGSSILLYLIDDARPNKNHVCYKYWNAQKRLYCRRWQHTFTVEYLQCFSLPLPGPFKINACPLRRISQNFVIATSTRLDISGVKLPANINDKYFKRNKQKRAKKAEGDIFSTKKEVRKNISRSLLVFKYIYSGSRLLWSLLDMRILITLSGGYKTALFNSIYCYNLLHVTDTLISTQCALHSDLRVLLPLRSLCPLV